MKLQLKRSNVLTSGAAKVPTASQLEYGELAINYNNSDPAIFLKDSNNNVIRISGVGNIADDGQVELPASTTPPNNPEAGNLWFNSDEGRLYIYYVDANTSQWVDASPDSYDPSVVPDMSDPNYQAGTLDDRYNSSQVGTTAPAVTTRQEGALWWNSSANEGKLYVLYNDPAPDGRKKWVEASPYPDTSSYVVKVDNGTQQNITGGGGLTVAGNVGIGTTSPAHNLDISPASGAAELKIAGAEGQEASIRLYADQGDDAADIKKLLTDTSGNFKIQHYSGSAFVDSMVIDNSGRLGVGTSSPFYKVHLEGSAPYVRIKNTSAPTDEKTWDFNAGTDGILRFRNSNDANSSSNNWLEVERNGVETNSIRLLTASGSERMRILSDGTIATGGLTATPGTVAAGSYIQHAANAGFFGNNGDAKFGSSANNPVLFQVNGSEKVRIDTSGRVGIGTSSPSHGLLTLSQSASSFLNALVIQQGNTGFASTDGLHIGISTGVDAYMMHKENRAIFFGTADTERMRIDSSGNVGIGEASPEDYGANYTTLETSGTYGGVFQSSSTDNSVKSYWYSDKNAGNARIGTNTNHPFLFTTNTVERMRIRSNGNVIVGPYRAPATYGTVAQNIPYEIKVAPYGWANGSEIASISMGSHNGTGQDDGQIVFKTAADVHSSSSGLQERVRILSTGGLTFNGDTAQANALDDYEEGTFTPSAFGSTTTGSTTYGLQYGAYVKVGQLCHVQIRMQVNSMTGTGNLHIGGLPFTSMNDSQRGYGSIAVSYVENLTMPGSGTQYGAFTEYNQTYIRMMAIRPNASILAIPVDGTFVILMSGTYRTT